MKKEVVEKILKSSSFIKFKGWIEPNEYGFSRTCSFDVRGVEYKIKWFCNFSTLYCGEMFLNFDDFRIENTWSHHYGKNLQFYRYGSVCAVIPIEKYLEEKHRCDDCPYMTKCHKLWERL